MPVLEGVGVGLQGIGTLMELRKQYQQEQEAARALWEAKVAENLRQDIYYPQLLADISRREALMRGDIYRDIGTDADLARDVQRNMLLALRNEGNVARRGLGGTGVAIRSAENAANVAAQGRANRAVNRLNMLGKPYNTLSNSMYPTTPGLRYRTASATAAATEPNIAGSLGYLIGQREATNRAQSDAARSAEITNVGGRVAALGEQPTYSQYPVSNDLLGGRNLGTYF